MKLNDNAPKYIFRPLLFQILLRQKQIQAVGWKSYVTLECTHLPNFPQNGSQYYLPIAIWQSKWSYYLLPHFWQSQVAHLAGKHEKLKISLLSGSLEFFFHGLQGEQLLKSMKPLKAYKIFERFRVHGGGERKESDLQCCVWFQIGEEPRFLPTRSWGDDFNYRVVTTFFYLRWKYFPIF